ncbi:hypothetical protein [Geminisphaera colitermitum]|uniref:hypothetical protein n=1 Tax=Geminisphaera colitermitum TaxID=1148786 RepID=UPI0001964E8D|nr:hypothetical protein [Geminisphaera colitermitum]
MDASAYISQVQLIGRAGGLIKTLQNFDKKRHDVPDAVNHATQTFLARLCSPELTEEAENLFQRTRAALNYKRKDLSLDVTAPTATLSARDFTYEIVYALSDAAPSEYTITRTLHTLRNGNLVHLDEFDTLFAGHFSAISFALRKGVRVEAVIDAIESLDDDNAPSPPPPATARPALHVDYPSDCSHCVLTVDGVEAEVICEGATLEMRFPRSGSPRELVTAFATLRNAFSLAKHTTLAGLL